MLAGMSLPLRFIPLWLAVCAVSAVQMPAWAEEEVVLIAPSPPLPAPSPSPCNGLPEDDAAPLLDRTHNVVSQSVCWPSQWFDRFFASPDGMLDEPASTLIRVIGGYRWQDNDDSGDEVRVRGSVNLPNISRRLRLTFRNDDDLEEDFAASTDTRPQDVGENEDTTFRAALNWAARQTERDNIDLEVGVRSEIKTFVRGRYRIRLPMPGEQWAFRFTENLYWIDGIGAGTQTRFEFDRPLASRTVLRFLTQAEHNEDLNERKLGWDLDQSAAIYVRLSSRAALQYSVGAQGFTEPSANVDVWHTSIRYRRNIWRPWLFWELEPFAFWPRLDDYHGVSGVVLRLETQFGFYDEPDA
jgi:hypothetical protein